MVGEDSKPINVGTDEVKIAEFQLHLSADAVYGEHYNIYFSDDSNATTLAVGATPEEALIADIDTTGTMGVEILKTVTITFNGNGGKTEENDTSYTQDDVPYNKATNLDANAFSRDGYSFKGWSTTVDPADDADINYANSASVTTKTDLTLYAVWTPADVNYTVKHLQQNTDLSTYAEVEADRETKQGKTGAQTEAEAKTYDGFTDQTITQQTIAADGSTVVEIKYDRNTYTVTFNANGGSTPTPESKTVTYGLPYGELADTTYTGKTFLGWFTAAEGGDQVTASTVFEETNSQTLPAKATGLTERQSMAALHSTESTATSP